MNNITVRLYKRVVENGLESLDGRDLLPVYNGTLDHIDVPITFELGVGDHDTEEHTLTLRISRRDEDDPEDFCSDNFRFDVFTEEEIENDG